MGEICFDGYLRSVVNNKYQRSQDCYTQTDARDLFNFGLMVQTVEEKNERQESQSVELEKPKIETFPVLDGIRKYASAKVLLVGKPGSGKSTALQKMLVDEAQKVLDGQASLIPVLIELRSWRTSYLALIKDFFRAHKLRLEEEKIDALLFEGKLLLLVDGVNELPADNHARQDILTLRETNPDTPMIFTTRMLGVGGDLGIEKKLEMLPLSEPQMRQFIQMRLPEQGNQMLQQLGDRLRKFGDTPLLLSMLCDVFKTNGRVPANLGSAFRDFANLYDGKLKENVPVYEYSRSHWSKLLQQLAFAMMPQDRPEGLRLSISRSEVEEILTRFLDGEKFPKPRDYAHHWLEDLLKHHLIQVKLVGTNEEIEFRHQLIQEYYAAEYLWDFLKNNRLSDTKLQHSYLNYLDWTESLALMLELVESEEQTVRVVRLALEVDLRLGARLAGAVKYGFQEKTVGLLVNQHLPTSTLSYLLGLTRSKKAVPYLKNQILTDRSTYKQSIKALGKIPNEASVDTLKDITDTFENDQSIHGEVALALGEIKTQSATSFLEDWNNRKVSEGDEMSYLKIRIEIALWKIYGDSRKPIMFKQIIPDYNEQDFERDYGEISLDSLLKAIEETSVCHHNDGAEFAVKKLTNYADEDVIPRLAKIVSTGRYKAKELALEILCNRGSKDTENIFKEELDNESFIIREIAVSGLAKTGNESVISTLVKPLFDKDRTVRDSVIRAFGKIGGDRSFKFLTELFKNNQDDSYSLGTIAKALGDIGREESIDLLISKIDKEDKSLSADIIEALRSIGGDKAIRTLIQLLNDEELDISDNVAETLTDLVQSDSNLPTLTQQLPHLLTLISTKSSQQALSVITAIQARCKYYNYDIAQTPLPPEDKPNPTTGNTYYNSFNAPVGQVVENLTVQRDNIATQNNS